MALDTSVDSGAPAAAPAVAPAPAVSSPARRGVTPLHGGIDVGAFYALHVLGAVFPITAGMLLYGWRALGTIAVVLASTGAAVAVWRRVGKRGRQLHPAHCLWMALLLSLTLPPHLLSDLPTRPGEASPWPVVPAAGFLLVTLTWLLGGLGSGRVHPVLVTYLALVILFQPLLVPHRVLRPDHLFLGDLLKAEAIDTSVPRTEAWVSQRSRPNEGSEAVYDPEPAAHRLVVYTSGKERPDRSSVSLQMILRDQMPPLEDLIIGGQPGPIGTSSGLAVIVGGLFLLYRGLIDYRIPVLATAAALAALLVLPAPVVITDVSTEWRWLAFREHYLGWPAAVTFANYEVLASPLLFVAFFLATSPVLRPMTRRGRTVYAALFGLLCAPAQLYGSVAVGPYVALLVSSLASPLLDRIFTPRPLV